MIGGGGVCDCSSCCFSERPIMFLWINDATCVLELFLIVANFNESAGNDHYGFFFKIFESFLTLISP